MQRISLPASFLIRRKQIKNQIEKIRKEIRKERTDRRKRLWQKK
jgi:hypothetical protein